MSPLAQAALLADPPRVREIAAEIVARGYQTEARALDTPTTTADTPLTLPPWGGLETLGWVVLAVVVLIGLAALARAVLDRRGEVTEVGETPAAAAAGADWAATGLREAENLAGQGRHAEALHALLLAAQNELRRRGRVTIADSWTSREILRRVPIPDDAAAPLHDLVRAVELSFFGRRRCGPEDYAAGRALYESVRRVLGEAAA